MIDLPSNPRRVWLRSFYGFSPEEDGYIGWTEEGPRERMLDLIVDGDLFLIYGAQSSQTEKSHRNRVLGFLEVRKGQIRDRDKSSAEGLRRKRAKGWQDKWTFAIPVVRAWRATEDILLERIAPTTYRSEAGQAIAVWSPPLLAEEAERAMKIRVREVSVHGEPPIEQDTASGEPLAQFFKPSRAVTGGIGLRTSVYEDGERWLYLARFEGDGYALLGRIQPMFDDRVLIKIGITNNPKRRLGQLNSGFPPAAIGQWQMILLSVPYPDKAAAEAAEQTFKDRAFLSLDSLGREFFHGKWKAAESLFAGIPGVSRFGS